VKHLVCSKIAPLYRTVFGHCAGRLQHGFLLLVRLYWGWGFFVAGKGKITNIDATASTFEMWEIPMPKFNAIAAGLAETVLGLTLLVGLASRLSAIPLIVVMIVAYLTAHSEDLGSLNKFVRSPPFTYLFACVIVLLFGPGKLSVDHLLKRRFFSTCDVTQESKGHKAADDTESSEPTASAGE